MCTRFVVERTAVRELCARLELDAAAVAAATAVDRFNIAPGTALLAFAPSFFQPRWGLIPAWSRDASRPSVNARAESLAERPAFRDAFRHRRCIVPASGFYEWEARGRARHPWVFRRHDGAAFFFAALWETWTAPGAGPLATCALITTAANPCVARIHDRMPALLDPAAARLWLDPTASSALLSSLLQPAPDDLLIATELIRRINHLEHDDPACLTPAADAPPDDQFTFSL